MHDSMDRTAKCTKWYGFLSLEELAEQHVVCYLPGQGKNKPTKTHIKIVAGLHNHFSLLSMVHLISVRRAGPGSKLFQSGGLH